MYAVGDALIIDILFTSTTSFYWWDGNVLHFMLNVT